MDRPGRLDVEREARAPDFFGSRHRLGAAAITGNLELRHRGALRRRERDFKAPARAAGVGRVVECGSRRRIEPVGQRGHLQQGLPRDRGIGVGEQMMRGWRERCLRRDRRFGDRLRGGQGAAERRRWHIVAQRYLFAECRMQRGRGAGRVCRVGLGFLQNVEHGRRRRLPPRRGRENGPAGEKCFGKVLGNRHTRLRQQDLLRFEVLRSGGRRIRRRLGPR